MMDMSDAVPSTDAGALVSSSEVPANQLGVSKGKSDTFKPESLSSRLGEVAAKVEEIDPRSAGRLRELGQILNDGEVGSASTIDLYGAINPAGIQESAFEVWQQRPVWLRFFEWVRNVLVLGPLCLTWYGLWQAAANYRLLLDLDPTRISEPFLLLWEKQFAPLAGVSGPSFSEVAAWDLFMLLGVLLLTVFVHRWRDWKEPLAEGKARELRQAVEAVLWDVDKKLAAVRHSQTPDAVAAELVKNMRAEQQHLRDLADGRVKEAEKLSSLGERLSSSAVALQEFSDKVTTVYEPLSLSIVNLSGRVHTMSQQQTAWAGTVEAVSTQLEGWSKSVGDAAQDLMQAAETVGTSTKDIAVYADMSASTTKTARDLLQSLTERLDRVTNGLRAATGEALKLTDQLDTVSAALATKLNEAAANLAGTADQFKGVGEVMLPAAKNFPEQANQFAGQLRTMSGQLERSASSFHAAAERMESSVGQISSLTASSAASLRDLTSRFEAAVDQVGAVAAELRSATQQAQTYTQSTWDTMQAMKKASEDLAPAVAAFSEQTRANLDELSRQTLASLSAFSREVMSTLETLSEQDAESHRRLADALRRLEGTASRGGRAKRPILEWLMVAAVTGMLTVICLVTTASAFGLLQ